MMTKSLPPGSKRDTFCRMLLHHIVGESLLPSEAASVALSVTKEWINLIVETVKHGVCNYTK